SLQTFVDTIALSDVVLDTWPFGAGNTNYQTFAMGVPVVTLPGRWIRGRGTLAHYTHMGIDDCVAQSPAEFVEIAHRLGTDHAYRKEIAAQIEARSDAVLEDEVCADAFAKFLAEVRAKA
ncbi:MAG: glycosyltransferase, partial [Pseudomonadota bacterium]|nr:glycosyltransferase [Pseudomonadota bacterium]